MARSGNYEDWLLKSLKDSKEAAAYLDAALAEGEPRVLLKALGDVVRAQGGPRNSPPLRIGVR